MMESSATWSVVPGVMSILLQLVHFYSILRYLIAIIALPSPAVSVSLVRVSVGFLAFYAPDALNKYKSCSASNSHCSYDAEL